MKYILLTFLSAILFGSSTPIGKMLLDSLPPFQLAGLLYLGAALGVFPVIMQKNKSIKIKNMDKKNLSRLIGAICFGGIIGPVLLLFGLKIASAASVSMWLNLELVATAILGYLIFRDHLGIFGWLGVLGTIIASLILSWHEGGIGLYALMLVAGASFCWGLDNHLTALIDDITPSQSTFSKGVIAGLTNVIISFFFENYLSDIWMILTALIVGVFAYGFSISLYILAAQNLGATRSQMIFSSAPFFGVILAVFIFGESISISQIIAAFVLIVSLTVLFREQHSHVHKHEKLNHDHMHKHDDKHHNHIHEEKMSGSHSHLHEHEPMSHIHPHLPNIHHRHSHN